MNERATPQLAKELPRDVVFSLYMNSTRLLFQAYKTESHCSVLYLNSCLSPSILAIPSHHRQLSRVTMTRKRGALTTVTSTLQTNSSLRKFLMHLKPLMLWHELQGLWRQRWHTLPLLLEVPHLWQTHMSKSLFFVCFEFLSVSCARCKFLLCMSWVE